LPCARRSLNITAGRPKFSSTACNATYDARGLASTNGSTEIVLAETCVALNVAARSVLGIPQAAGTPQGNRSLGRGQLQAEYVKQRGANRAWVGIESRRRRVRRALAEPAGCRPSGQRSRRLEPRRSRRSGSPRCAE
jgi:hypothetical protein